MVGWTQPSAPMLSTMWAEEKQSGPFHNRDACVLDALQVRHPIDFREIASAPLRESCGLSFKSMLMYAYAIA